MSIKAFPAIATLVFGGILMANCSAATPYYDARLAISSDITDCSPSITIEGGSSTMNLTYTVVNKVGTLNRGSAGERFIVVTVPSHCKVPTMTNIKATAPASISHVWGLRSGVVTTGNGGAWPYAFYLTRALAYSDAFAQHNIPATVSSNTFYSINITAATPMLSADGLLYTATPNDGKSLIEKAPKSIAAVLYGGTYIFTSPARTSFFPRPGGFVSAPFMVNATNAQMVKIGVGIAMSRNPLNPSTANIDTDTVFNGETVNMPATIQFDLL
ncbi:hypothetical protein ACGVWS_07800 [Enterobacteriaceae bacterium LUAb1]